MWVRCVGERGEFEWRAPTGRWRWLILGALGVAPFGCGGRTNDGGSAGTNQQSGGGAGGSNGTAVPGYAVGGGSGAGERGSIGGTGSGSARATGPTACEPPLIDLGGGWEQCESGMIHRAELGACSSSVPRDLPPKRLAHDPTRPDGGPPGECRYDSDCTERAYGHCEWSPYVPDMTFCEYGCSTNADCEPGFACVCGEPVGACRPATCSVDAECGAGFLCSDFITEPGCGGQAFACQTAEDACAAHSDCPENEYCVRGKYPVPVAPGAPSYCSPALCIVGRPFLVAGSERLAPPVCRGDWYAATGSRAAAPAGVGLGSAEDPELRAAVRAGWLEQGLMEHASVAAFARFSLQLLALGAPAELCARAARATGDEIEHARACFELARRHSEADVGPGPLDLQGALEATDLEAIVLGTIAEGCIGETVAAMEAAEALAHCRDEAARAVLARIAQDETEHAELAWRFVAWALDVGAAALRERVRAAFLAATDAASASAAPSARDLQLAQHGLIAPSLRAELRGRVLRDVIEPCARALVGPARPCDVSRSAGDHPQRG